MDEKERKDFVTSTDCNHEMDPATERYDHKLGRVGYCLKCKNKIYFTTFVTNPKRERVKMKKKQRRKINKELKEKKNGS